ncbi:uncharacterized protein LOC119281960 [Triticum dicoccoides]|uniref:uncharacterized protein LOC119281960 n=1 Tax=Triticum dicoccoides TaxID=85692 RepID=UPI00188F12D7|nr:uncharacterized protein LOC119281960 [Triticum dicoccoides]
MHPSSSPIQGFYCPSPSSDGKKGGCIFFFPSAGYLSKHHGWHLHHFPDGEAPAVEVDLQALLHANDGDLSRSHLNHAGCHRHPVVRRRRPVAVRKKKAMLRTTW